MGHLVEPGKAIAWRGPMAGKALGQLIDADWGDTELLLVDLPPGTGDVQLTMLQRFKPGRRGIVSTPQDLALIDATRAMHCSNRAMCPIIGLVENMAGYVCPHCGEISDPFGSGRGGSGRRAHGACRSSAACRWTLEIRMASDAGQPPAAGDGDAGRAFAAIAAELADWLDKPERGVA